MGYGVGLMGLIGVKILAPGFYARRDIRTPVRIAIVVLVLTQAMNLVFVPLLGHAGLALSIGLGALVNATWLFVGLRRKAYRPCRLGAVRAACCWPAPDGRAAVVGVALDRLDRPARSPNARSGLAACIAAGRRGLRASPPCWPAGLNLAPIPGAAPKLVDGRPCCSSGAQRAGVLCAAGGRRRACRCSEVAVSIGQDEYPGSRHPERAAEIALAERLKRRIPADAVPLQRLRWLNRFFFHELGFAGNVNDYYDPRQRLPPPRAGHALRHPDHAGGALRRTGHAGRAEGRAASFPGHFLVNAEDAAGRGGDRSVHRPVAVARGTR